MTTAPALPAWAAELLGDGAAVVDVFDGGTSRATLLVEVPPDRRRLVARHDSGTGPLSATGFTLAREAAVFAFAADAGLPVPRPVALAGDGASFAVEEVPGTPETGAVALDDYLGVLARLHAVDLGGLPAGFVGLDAEGAEDLELWEQAARRGPRPSPVLEHAFAVLRAHGWDAPADVALCHGDAGAGNYLHEGPRVTGLIDWEMAHTGDPHDDLASIAVRSMLNGIDVGDLRGRIRDHWEPVSGRTFDPARFSLAVLAVLTRMVASCHAALGHRDPGKDRTVQLMGLPVMEVHLLRTAARIDGAELPPLDDVTPDPWMLAEVSALLAEAVRHELVPRAAEGEAGRARRLRYVADQLAAALDALDELDDPTPRPHGDGIQACWYDAHRRLAALPASRALARAPIPGMD